MREGQHSELRAALTSGDPRAQILAARRSARANDRELVGALLALGDSPDAEVRAAGYWAVDQLRVEAAVPRLVEALSDPDFFARSNAGWALVHLGSAVVRHVEAVAKESASADAREMALLVLERVPDASSRAAASSPVVAAARGVAAAHDINNEVQFLTLVAPSIVEELAEVVDPDLRGAAADLADAAEQLRARTDRLVALVRVGAQSDARSRDLALAALVHDIRQTMSVVAGNAEYLRDGGAELPAVTLATLTRVSQCVHVISTILRQASFGKGEPATVQRAGHAAQ